MPFFSTMAGTRCLGSVKVGIIRSDIGNSYITKYSNDGSLMWAASIEGNSTINPLSLLNSIGVKTDSSGNVFVFGPFLTFVKLYSATGGTSKTLTATGTARNCYIAKYNPDGIIQWATFGNSNNNRIITAWNVEIDPSGNVLMVGNYVALPTFQSASPSVVTLSLPTSTSVLINNGFVVQYNTDGIVQWGFSINTTATGVFIYAIALDSSGNIFITGRFGGTATFNSKSPDVTTKTLTEVGGGASSDAYLAKYSPDGIIQWVAQIASTTLDQGFSLAIDSSMNIVVFGYCNLPCTLYSASGGTPVSVSNTQNTNYLVKYNTNGDIIWVAGNNGVQSTQIGVALDANQNIFVSNSGSTSFVARSATGGTTKTMTTIGNLDVVICKYNASGIIQWLAQIGSSGEERPIQVATDSNGNVFVTGYYSGAVTFFSVSPSTIKKTLRAVAGQDTFVAKYDTNGIIQWAAQTASSGNDTGFGVTVDPSGNVITCGATLPPVTFADAV
jgi:hypothetical protein